MNGAGKSSVMRILAGVDTDFSGKLTRAPGIRSGYLPQEPELDEGESVLANIQPAVQPVKDKLKEFEEARGPPGLHPRSHVLLLLLIGSASALASPA